MSVSFPGEIIPQSICSKHALAVGAYSAYFVRALMLLCGVVAYPISKLLDWVLGAEQEVGYSSPIMLYCNKFCLKEQGQYMASLQ